jgi:hypothetical protein
MERLLKEGLKQFEEVKDPKLVKSYQSLIKGIERDLLALRNNTEEVMKNTELMKKGLDSLTWAFLFSREPPWIEKYKKYGLGSDCRGYYFWQKQRTHNSHNDLYFLRH